MTTKPSSTKVVGKVDIEALMNKREQVSNIALKAAIAKLEEQKQKEQEEALLEHLKYVQNHVNSAVSSLREARKKEKAYKIYLERVVAAEQQFYAEADIKAFNKSIDEARVQLLATR